MNLKKALPVILAVVVGIGLGVGGMVGVQKYILPKAQAPQAETKAPAKKDGPLVAIGEFTVNLQGGSFLKTSITVEATDAKAEKILKEKEAYLKDRTLAVLSGKTLEDVRTPEAREKLRQELIVELNEVAEGKVQNVLFLSFVYQ